MHFYAMKRPWKVLKMVKRGENDGKMPGETCEHDEGLFFWNAETLLIIELLMMNMLERDAFFWNTYVSYVMIELLMIWIFDE